MTLKVVAVITILFIENVLSSPQSISAAVRPVATTPSCQRQLIASDVCFKKVIIVSNEELKAPTTYAEVESVCREIRNNLSCVKKYTGCLQLFSRTIFGLIFQSTREMYNDACATTANKKELFRHFQCLRHVNENALQRKELTEIADKLTAMLAYVNRERNENLIDGACCAYVKAVEEARRILSRHCIHFPGAAEYFTVMFKQAASGAMDLVCGRLISVDTCRSVDVHQMTKLSEIAANPGVQKTGFLVPLIHIANKIGIVDTVQHALSGIL